VAGLWTTSLGTLASRLLGVVRDAATARLLGLGPAADALVLAFRIPNLFRRVLGEGALTACYLPLLAEHAERDPQAAWQFASVVFTWLAVLLALLVLLGEAVCLAAWWAWGQPPHVALLFQLLAWLWPYLLLGCLAAQLSATLQALGRFRAPALLPTVLNLAWIAGAWWAAPALATSQPGQAQVLAVCILAGGASQLFVLWPALHRAGFRFDYHWAAARQGFRRLLRALAPLAAGYAVTQVNTLVDSLIAWGLAAPPGSPAAIPWWPGQRYPLEAGAASAVYFGERFYQLPLGLVGIAVATVIFPLLARHAARQDRVAVGRDLALGLRLVWFVALPAGAGLMLLAAPLTRLLFERGEFAAADTARAARLIFWYCSGVWAYCAAPVLIRGCYALGERLIPIRAALAAMAVNLVLNLLLVWPLAERGLALSTALAAVVHVGLLLIRIHPLAPLPARALARTLAGGLIATAAMSLAVSAVLAATQSASDLSQVLGAVGAGVACYLAVARLLRMEELGILFARPAISAAPDDPPAGG
jgi:putative peptidoglycan lipid II flippase